jgi:hypothetical protein
VELEFALTLVLAAVVALLIVAEWARVPYETRSEAYQRLVRELLEAQREVLIGMRDRGEINDEVLRRLERELDLEDSRLEI